MGTLHKLLAAAIAAAGSPEGPWEADLVARPQIGNFGYLAVALLCADTVRPFVAKKGARRFDAFVVRARDVYERHLRGEAGRAPRKSTD